MSDIYGNVDRIYVLDIIYGDADIIQRMSDNDFKLFCDPCGYNMKITYPTSVIRERKSRA